MNMMNKCAKFHKDSPSGKKVKINLPRAIELVEGLDHSKLVRIPGSTSSRRDHRFVGCHEATRTRMSMKARMDEKQEKS